MKFISDKKAGYIQKDWEVDESNNSFETDNSFEEEFDDFIDKEDVGVSPQLKRQVTNTRKSFTENLF